MIVNGRLCVEGGELVGVDEPAIVERAERASVRLLDEAQRATGVDFRRR